MAPQYDPDYEWVPYARISDDREGGGLGADGQVKDCNELGRRLGGRILPPCIDNDLTAYDKSRRYKPRPGYELLYTLLRGRPGRRGVLTWHTDRLHRTPRELEDFIDLVEATGATVQTVKAGHIDLSTASGRMTARVHCAVARHESEHKSERILRKVAELAEMGKIANGGPRPFGYRRIYAGEGPRRKILRDELEPAEAEIVRECARKLLAGDTLRSIVGDLNARGVETSTGGRWSMQGMRWMLRSGRIAGLRERRDVVVGPAQWPAIIDRETHEQLRGRLDSRHRPAGSLVRLHWLSGFVYCASCESRMRVKPAHGKLVYGCPPRAEGGCGGRVIGKAGLEDLVRAYLIGRLTDPRTLRELAARQASDHADTAALIAEIEADERRLALLKEALSDGDEHELPEAIEAVRRIRDRLASTRRALAAVSQVPQTAHGSLPDLAARWDELDLDRKQGLTRLFVSRVRIAAAVRGRDHFDPDRVDIEPA